MAHRAYLLPFLIGALLLCPSPTSLAESTQPAVGHVNVIELDNEIITPVIQQYILNAIHRSEQERAVCLIIQLDTPGGLLESTRTIVKGIMNARTPIAVYVGPSGSRAGSAGVFITMAAHIAAMAPSTNIGAAHPVMAGGGGGSPIKRLIRQIQKSEKESSSDENEETEQVIEQEHNPMFEKIVNDTVAWITTIAKTRGRNEEWAKQAVTQSFSVPETEAVEKNIVDFVARDIEELLEKMNGKTVDLSGTPITLATKNVRTVPIPMTAREKLLAVITNPNVAYLLMMLGTMGLIFEFTHPGIGFPGIAGLICLVLALYALQTLPVSYAAVALLIIGLGLLAAETQVVSHGLLAVGGLISLTLGSLMLFETPNPELRVSLHVILPTVITLGGLILFLLQRAVSAQSQPIATGKQGLVGEIGIASTTIDTQSGKIFVHGEYWNATSQQRITKGKSVRILQVKGLAVTVEQA